MRLIISSWFLLILLSAPSLAQEVSLYEGITLQDITGADVVQYEHPDWLGPAQWVVIPASYSGSCFRGQRVNDTFLGFLDIEYPGIECNPEIQDLEAMEDMSRWNGGSSWQDGGWGEIYFYNTWQEFPVSKYICDGAPDTPEPDSTVLPTYVGTHICTDNIEEYEPWRTSPYDSFPEMDAAQNKCFADLYATYDSGHSPPWPWSSTWTQSVPAGWFRGQDASLDSTLFMDWCVHGGVKPLSPTPFPEGSRAYKNESRTYWNYVDSNAGEITYAKESQLKYGDPVAWWEVDDELFAIEKCERVYEQIKDERKRAFQVLCDDEAYGHFAGCKAERERCMGDTDDHIVTGIGTCCTERYKEYHFFPDRRYMIPCKPIGAFRWYDSGSLSSAKWVDEHYDNTGIGNDGWGDRVNRADNRGFVGSGGLMNAIGAGGKDMEVYTMNPGDKIGSYFYFDISSGTVGFKSFEEAKNRQNEVRLPGDYNDGRKQHYIRGTWDCNMLGYNCSGDLISYQREGVEGWVRNLYFCEETFTREQLDAINMRWGTIPDVVKQVNHELKIDCDDYAATYGYDTQYMEECAESPPDDEEDPDPIDLPLPILPCPNPEEYVDPDGNQVVRCPADGPGNVTRDAHTAIFGVSPAASIASLERQAQTVDPSSAPASSLWWFSASYRSVHSDGSYGQCGPYEPWTGPFPSHAEAQSECDRLSSSSLQCGCIVNHFPPDASPSDSEIVNPGLLHDATR